MPDASRLLYRLERWANRGYNGEPIATIGLYGPDAARASKISLGVGARRGELDIIGRWISDNIDIRQRADILAEIIGILESRGVLSLAFPAPILGCPHEEGPDYPIGSSCPKCPYWAGRPRPIDGHGDM